jgi:tetratricopeptide (TPR) repeat protein
METKHIFKTTFVFFFIVICATQSTLSQDADFYFKKGKDALSKNSLNKANEYFQKATQLSPSDPDIYFRIGDAFNDLTHSKNYYIRYPDLALKYYLKAIEYRPLFKDAMLKVGDCYKNKKMYARASDYYFEALQLDTTDISTLDCIGDLFIAQTDTLKAIEYYQKGTDFGDSSSLVTVFVFEKLGMIYFNMGEYNKAMEWFSRQVVNESDLSGNYHLAKCRLMLGDTVRALTYFASAYQTKDNSLFSYNVPEFLGDYARIEFLHGDCENAIKHYRELIELSPSKSQYYFDLGKVYEKMGNNERQNYFYKIAAKMGNKKAKEYLRRK